MLKTAENPAVDIVDLLDKGTFSLYQTLIVILIALAIIMDGFDSQLIGYTIPVLMDVWHVPREAFVPAVTGSYIGMIIGSFTSGFFADKLGRKKLLILTLCICGLGTLLSGLAQDPVSMAILRIITGLGIGGAIPVCTTMVAEFTPRRNRTIMITFSTICVPLGGSVAGIFANFILPQFGWRALYFIGGLMPFALILVILAFIPETPRYLVRNPQKWPILRRLLGRMGHKVSDSAHFVDEDIANNPQIGGYKVLFSKILRQNTIAIWLAFFFSLMTIYLSFGWLPTMLKAEGVDLYTANLSLTLYNFGGVIAPIICSLIIAFVGSRIPMLVCAIGGFISVFLLMTINIAHAIPLMLILITMHGALVNCLQAALYALCAFVYPTYMRARGTSGAAGFGRLGAILAGIIGAPIITQSGANGYFMLLGVSMVIVSVVLFFINKNIPKAR